MCPIFPFGCFKPFELRFLYQKYTKRIVSRQQRIKSDLIKRKYVDTIRRLNSTSSIDLNIAVAAAVVPVSLVVTILRRSTFLAHLIPALFMVKKKQFNKNGMRLKSTLLLRNGTV